MITSTVLILGASLALASPPPSSDTEASPAAAEAAPRAANDVGRAERGPFKLRYDSRGDPLVTGFSAAAWIATEATSKSVLSPSTCRLCERDPQGLTRLNLLDAAGRSLRWSLEDQRTADMLSNVTGFALVPLSIIGLDLFLAYDNGVLAAAQQDLVIIAQSTALALLLNQTVKFLVGRERPFVHVLSPAERGHTHDPLDNNLSFFSGHSTFVFSLTVAAATVAELRSYEGRWIIWAVGLPLAASTAYLRMAADKHYLTDVLVGTAVGSLFGFGVPMLFHGRAGRYGEDAIPVDVQLVPAGNGAALVGTF